MKKNFKITAFLLSIISFLVPFKVFAQEIGFGWFSEVVASLIGGIGQLFSYIAGIFLTLSGSLVDLMLDLNISYLTKDNDLVSTGWQISRDLANLGFVLAIIVIAFATIIQYKSYGAKKMLPKLIAAALLVNFSMAIAMPVIGFSNTVTKFFLAGQINTGYGENIELSQTIAGAFGPQRFLMGQTDGDDPVAPTTGEDPGMFSGFGTAVIMAATSVLFTIVFTTIATIVFFALAFMLMVRYVFLSFLLILAPMAWLVWVIPGLENQFSKWWSNFFKWSFFAPAVSFFIYLTLVGAEELSNMSMSGIEGNFTGDLKNIMSQGAQMVILCGLMIGGLIAAQNLGIHGAKGAIGIAKNTGNWGKRWAARKGKQWGSAPVRRKYGKENKSLAERTQNWASQGGIKGMIGKTFVRPTANLSALGGDKIIKEHDEAVKKLTTDQKRAELATTISTPRKISLLKGLIADGNFKDSDAKYINNKTKNQFAEFGQEGDFKKLVKAGGITPEINEALKNNDMGALERSTLEHIKPLKTKDVENIPWNSAFKASSRGEGALSFDNKKLNSLLDNQLKAIATANPSLTYKIIPTLDSEALGEFEKKYRDVLKKEGNRAIAAGDNDLFDRLVKAEKGFDNSIAKHTYNV